MTSQTQTKKSERRNRITVLGFVLIGICFAAYFILAIVSKWTHWHYLVGMSALFTALLVCLVLLAYYYRDIEQARKAAESNTERIRNAPVSTSAGIFLLNLEHRGFKRLAWEIRKKAVDGDSATQQLIKDAWVHLHMSVWETNTIIQIFLATLNEFVGYYFGQNYARGVLVGLSKDVVNQTNAQRLFMLDMIRLFYPDLTEWKLFGTSNETGAVVKDS